MNTLSPNKKTISQCLDFISLTLASLILVSPFIFNKAMIVGSDTIFHFNRICSYTKKMDYFYSIRKMKV